MPVDDRKNFAEIFEDWANNGDIDGFNAALIARRSNPEPYTDLVELWIATHQGRKITWDGYGVPGGIEGECGPKWCHYAQSARSRAKSGEWRKDGKVYSSD
ncbi:hypothetical protein F5882DRAFT_467309 [Hyaloscypha sp. PMI_1271]|nr:hypothetical protein F5882DRAFT_467309 [Hyaloscypha sp. PMI_1271]